MLNPSFTFIVLTISKSEYKLTNDLWDRIAHWYTVLFQVIQRSPSRVKNEKTSVNASLRSLPSSAFISHALTF